MSGLAESTHGPHSRFVRLKRLCFRYIGDMGAQPRITRRERWYCEYEFVNAFSYTKFTKENPSASDYHLQRIKLVSQRLVVIREWIQAREGEAKIEQSARPE